MEYMLDLLDLEDIVTVPISCLGVRMARVVPQRPMGHRGSIWKHALSSTLLLRCQPQCICLNNFSSMITTHYGWGYGKVLGPIGHRKEYRLHKNVTKGPRRGLQSLSL